MANHKRIINEAGTKTCSQCKIDKHISEFPPLKTGVFGVHAWCRHCSRLREKERLDRNREKNRAMQRVHRLRDPEGYRVKQKARRDKDGRLNVRAKQKAWHARNPARKMFTQAKGRAKKFGLEFLITLDDLLPLPGVCPVLGIPLRKGVSSDDSNAYSLDRVDNSKGYIPGNVIVMSRRANVLKRDATPMEIQALARWISQVAPSS